MTVKSCALIGGVLFKTENDETQSFSQKGDLKVFAYNLEHVCEFDAIYVH